MMSTNSGVELVADAHALLGEGPVWDARTGRLIWTDILSNRLHQFDPRSDDRSVLVSQPVGALVLRRRGGHIAAVRDGFATVDIDTGALDVLWPVEADIATNRMNDGKCDPVGRLWAGTMNDDAAPGRGALYRLDLDHQITRVVSSTSISNGLAWSNDNRTMYYIDSGLERIDAFDFDLGTGEIDWARTVAAFQPQDGRPDGMTIDAEGYLWVAMAGGWSVRRYAVDGRLDREVHVPARLVTSCAFGGPDLRDLYITTAGYDVTANDSAQPHAGGLFRHRPGVQGLPAEAYGA
jgi:sugar lactone lactonase YvrE